MSKRKRGKFKLRSKTNSPVFLLRRKSPFASYFFSIITQSHFTIMIILSRPRLACRRRNTESDGLMMDVNNTQVDALLLNSHRWGRKAATGALAHDLRFGTTYEQHKQ
jgi:hypothetical protein